MLCVTLFTKNIAHYNILPKEIDSCGKKFTK